MLQRFKIPIIILVTVLLNQAAGYAVHAAVPNDFLPAGKTQYAIVQDGGPSGVFPELGWVDLRGASTTLDIPPGRKADLMIVFCGEMLGAGTATVSMRVFVASVVATPSETQMDQGGPDIESKCAIFFVPNAPGGEMTIKAQWKTSGEVANMGNRSMLVIANLH